MIRVVIDTNLLIDGSSDFFNFANRIIDLVISGHIEAYANLETLRENKFLVKKKIGDEGYQKKLEYFFEVLKPVDTKIINKVTEDPEDNKILASAMMAQADYLITSDRHLLNLEKVGRIKIIRPSEFWSRYEEGTDLGWVKWMKNFIN